MAPTTLTLAGTEVPRIGMGTNRLTNIPNRADFVRQAVATGIQGPATEGSGWR
jgi:hypothetical protein